MTLCNPTHLCGNVLPHVMSLGSHVRRLLHAWVLFIRLPFRAFVTPVPLRVSSADADEALHLQRTRTIEHAAACAVLRRAERLKLMAVSLLVGSAGWCLLDELARSLNLLRTCNGIMKLDTTAY